MDIPTSCIICGTNLSSDRPGTCGRACNKELKARLKLLDAARLDLIDSARCLAEFEAAPGVGPPEVWLTAVKALEVSALAYAAAAVHAKRLPK